VVDLENPEDLHPHLKKNNSLLKMSVLRRNLNLLLSNPTQIDPTISINQEEHKMLT